jgi:hypothetical protein
VLTFSGLGKNGKLFDATMLIVLELLTAPASGAAMKAVAEPARASTHAADCTQHNNTQKESIFLSTIFNSRAFHCKDAARPTFIMLAYIG